MVRLGGNDVLGLSLEAGDEFLEEGGGSRIDLRVFLVRLLHEVIKLGQQRQRVEGVLGLVGVDGEELAVLVSLGIIRQNGVDVVDELLSPGHRVLADEELVVLQADEQIRQLGVFVVDGANFRDHPPLEAGLVAGRQSFEEVIDETGVTVLRRVEQSVRRESLHFVADLGRQLDEREDLSANVVGFGNENDTHDYALPLNRAQDTLPCVLRNGSCVPNRFDNEAITVN